MALVTVDWKPNEQHLRHFGTLCVVVFAAFGAWVLWRRSAFGMGMGPEVARYVSGALWSLAAVCGVLRWAAPRWLRPLYVGLMATGLPIGFVISHVAMAIVFFGVVTPIALVFRVLGRDALERMFDRDAPTYWIPRRRVVDAKRYFHQF